MAFSWSNTISEGDPIETDEFVELRDNVDTVDDNKCETHNSSVYDGENTSENTDNNSGYDGSQYSTNKTNENDNYNGTANTSVYSNYDSLVT